MDIVHLSGSLRDCGARHINASVRLMAWDQQGIGRELLKCKSRTTLHNVAFGMLAASLPLLLAPALRNILLGLCI